MFYGFLNYLYNRLPYARYDNTREEKGTFRTSGTCATSESSEASTETSIDKISISKEECDIRGDVETITTYSSTTSHPNSPRGQHITNTTPSGVRTGDILSYNERTGECVVSDCHGNIITIYTSGNPF